MSIDPRIMKTLLQLQLMPSLDLTGSSGQNILSSGSGDSTSLFGTLLSQMLSGSADAFADTNLGAITGDMTAVSSLFKQPLPFYKESDSSSTVQQPTAFDTLIKEASSKYGVDSSLIRAVIDTESSFDPNSVSSAGAKGLMQLMDGTARGLGVSDSFDPRENIEGGTRYLAYLLNKYGGSEQVALAAYNAGPGRVDRAGIHSDADFAAKIGSLPTETQRYVGKVQKALGQYNTSSVY
ncbi:lytic transglycosylase domain-containing protein [Paenibacillus nasutitermitis]|uniref:Slt family transglycosylase n=1 Tax=Paenibacillus nasutitermitis TaxID=1652958 RepID=A0A916Z148_9BACL|nr:lytic transglycosylase domain-containing protein [Paenibacillus nasutitermitis]GGD71257.1 Slt family transglycosylase [Paenibacillus nasutitermitis]